MQKFGRLQDVVARRHGLPSYGGAMGRDIDSRPTAKSSAKGSVDVLAIVRILNWGRDNCYHLKKLREAQRLSPSSSSPAGVSSNHEHL
jgi:hypothetical protein